MVGFAAFKADSEHKEPMLSQNKALTNEDLLKWMNSMHKKGYTDYSASEKLDGMSCSLHYFEGRLQKAVSRGDGYVGTDITGKVSYIIPVNLNTPFTGEVRGELLLSNSNFKTLNEVLVAAGVPAYENQRNGVVGVLNSEDIFVDRISLLTFKAFRLLYDELPEESNEFFTTADTITSDLEFAKSIGFLTANNIEFSFSYNDMAELERVLEFFISQQSNSAEFMLDGVVFRVLDNADYISLGSTSHHPIGAVAWKFPSDYQDVIIKNIEWSMGTTDISPVAVFEPTLIGGAMISRVSLKSVKNMVDKGVTIGGTARVHRSGSVIPWLSCMVF